MPLHARSGEARGRLHAGSGRAFHLCGIPSGEPELHLLGVYEARSDHRSEGAVSVNVTRKAPLILALSSYEPIHWTVDAASGSRIQRIILNGYYPQRVTAPAGIPVENHSGSGQWLGAYAYAWPSSSGGSDTPGLVSALEQTHLPAVELVRRVLPGDILHAGGVRRQGARAWGLISCPRARAPCPGWRRSAGAAAARWRAGGGGVAAEEDSSYATTLKT